MGFETISALEINESSIALGPLGGESRSSRPLTQPGLFAGASIPQVLSSFAFMLGVCLVCRVYYALRSFDVDPDLWWHIKIGQSILATHRWPITDPYSFTAAGQHWRAYEWLGDIIFAAVYRIGGLRGLGALLIVLGSLFALALYYYTTIRCNNPKAGFLATAVLINLVNVFNLRPQMLAYLYLVLTLIVLERFRQGKRGEIWLLPLLMVVWINTHGLWIIGLGTIGAYLASGLMTVRVGGLETQLWNAPDRRQLSLVFLLSVTAIFITPYGAGLATLPFQMNSSPVGLANVQEWQPMVFNLPGDKLFLYLILGFLLVQVLARLKWRLEELGLFLFGAMMAFLHLRFLPLFAVFFAPIFAVILARWLPRYDRAKEIYALNAAVIVSLLGAMVWYFPSQSDYSNIVDRNLPVAAVRYLDTHSVPVPMYNRYEFGGYLLWARGPEHKVFIDGRGELYEPVGILSDYIRLANFNPGSLEILQKYNIQSCLLSPGDALSTVLTALPDWKTVFSDDHSVLFVRRQSDVGQQPGIRTAQNDPVAGGGI
jgi:hypothetical protein